MAALVAHAAQGARSAKVLPAGTAADTPESLIESSRRAARGDPDTSRRLAERALELLSAHPDPDLQLRAHIQLCDYYSERNRDLAHREISQARELAPAAKRAGLLAAVLTCERDLAEIAGDSAQAMALFQQAVTMAESWHEDEILADALFQRGYLRGVQGEFANGLADMQRAGAIFEHLNLPQQVQTTTDGVATIYNRLGDYAQARKYYEASLKSNRAAGLTREQLVTEHNLGRVLENLRDWDAAQRSFESVLALSREISYVRGQAYALRGLASVRNARGEPAAALALLESAEKLQRQMQDERLRAQILQQRGVALRILQRPNESVAALQQALQIFSKADSLPEVGVTHGELARSLTAVSDWRGAYEHQVQFQNANDMLLQRQLDQRFATLRMEYDIGAKERENVLLQRENEATERALAQERRATRLQATVLALTALLAAVLATLAWRQRRSNKAILALAMTDELTGLPNRRHVLGRLEAALVVRAPGRASLCALLIADIDHFKPINDEHGHLIGDEVLRAVAMELREVAREPTSLGRLGGEEFVFVLPDATEAAATRLAERVLGQIRTLDVSRWLPAGNITVSVGITLSVPGDTVSHLLRRADAALYAAKAAGRDRFAVRLADAGTASRASQAREASAQI